MKKIISLYQRDRASATIKTFVRNEITPGAEWVIAGEGIATRKFDGTCCLVQSGRLFKRFDAKNGKLPPPLFQPAQDPDPITGHWPGWVPVGEEPESQWHREAFASALQSGTLADGTYELCGPKIQNSAERFDRHLLIRHGEVVLADAPREYNALREFLRHAGIEGVVWHHPDGRMVKAKRRDFAY